MQKKVFGKSLVLEVVVVIMAAGITPAFSTQVYPNGFNIEEVIEGKTINVEKMCSSLSEPPEIEWQKTFGGSKLDRGYSVQQTSDSGYFIVGSTFSYGNSDTCEAYLIKTDEEGNSDWEKHNGETQSDARFEGWQTSDGGYIIGGSYQPSQLVQKVYLKKVDSNGNTVWEKTHVINLLIRQDTGMSVKQTSDDGYIVTGGARYALREKAFLLKTYGSGNKDWVTFPGDTSQTIFIGSCVEQTSDGGYIIVGFKTTLSDGDTDVWLCKTNSGGSKQWDRTYGGSKMDMGYFVQQTSDGGYILVGQTSSYGTNGDVYLIKTGSSGNLEWQKNFDGSGGMDISFCVRQTDDDSDGDVDDGYVIAAMTQDGNDVDDWIIKTDSTGTKEWDESYYNSSSPDDAQSIWQTSDGGYIYTGYTGSSGDGDVILVKLKYNQPPNTPSNPDPLDGATGVDVDADLSWTGGDPDPGDTVTYDVYFGTTSPPPLAVSGHSATTYNPGTMNPNTQYFWQIVAWDNHGASTSGPEWDFTTENNPPYVPSSPNPYDGEPGVDVDADLSWTGGDPDPGDTVTYDVYFGTTSPPPLAVSGHSATTYNPGTMNPNTQYFWQIVAWDNHGASTTGPIWDFITGTGNNPPNTPSKPSGPTTGTTGTSYPYNTSAIDPDGDDVKYGWDWDGNDIVDEWTSFYSSGTAISTSHSWRSDGTYNVKVMAEDTNGAQSDWSDPLSVSMPKNKPYINRPFLQFLEQYPILYQLLQRFLQL